VSLTVCPHYRTDPNVTWGWYGVPPNCAVLCGFAICALVSLLWQHSVEREISSSHSSVCTRSMYAWFIIATLYSHAISMAANIVHTKTLITMVGNHYKHRVTVCRQKSQTVNWCKLSVW